MTNYALKFTIELSSTYSDEYRAQASTIPCIIGVPSAENLKIFKIITFDHEMPEGHHFLLAAKMQTILVPMLT